LVLSCGSEGSDDGRAAVGAVEPAVGDLLVRGLGEVDAVPAEVRRRVGAGVGARHAAPRAVLVVVLAAAGAAARLERRAEPCACRKIITSVTALA
jgi:hypothetical protein